MDLSVTVGWPLSWACLTAVLEGCWARMQAP